MAINLLQDKGTTLHRQDFTWKDLLGQEDMAGRFQTALEEEDRHLASLRAWMEQICLNEAGVQ